MAVTGIKMISSLLKAEEQWQKEMVILFIIFKSESVLSIVSSLTTICYIYYKLNFANILQCLSVV